MVGNLNFTFLNSLQRCALRVKADCKKVKFKTSEAEIAGAVYRDGGFWIGKTSPNSDSYIPLRLAAVLLCSLIPNQGDVYMR